MAKRFSKARNIMAVDLSHPDIRIVYTFLTFTQICKELKLTRYRLQELIDGNKSEIIVRSAKTKILYKVSIENPVVVHARPERFDYEEIDFTSVAKCIQFFGIGPNTYYRRLNNTPLGVESPKPIKDKDGIKWYLTFFNDARKFQPTKEEVNYIPEEEW